MEYRILLLIVSILFTGTVMAESTLNKDTISVRVYFRQGYSILESAYRNNGTRLEMFAAQFRALQADRTIRLRYIHIDVGASPEGSSSLNRRLSDKRAIRIMDYLRNHTSFPDSLVKVSSHGINWERLKKLVAASDMPYKDEVLDVLHTTPEQVVWNNKIEDERKLQLKALHNGQPYRYMYEHFFPELRSAGVNIYCEFERLPKLELPSAGIKHPAPKAETLPLNLENTSVTPESAPRKPFCMVLKTNMLYDAFLIPNLGVEFHIRRGWSVGGNWMYAWWKNDTRHNYWRVYGGELDIRKYMGHRATKNPLTGHHLGIYSQILTYDFETGGRGYMAGTPGGTLLDKANYTVGLEYGYSLPVNRKLNIDFTLGAGYMTGQYHEYLPLDGCNVWQSTKQRRWWGPTKAEISLVWFVGRNSYNGKGGKQ